MIERELLVQLGWSDDLVNEVTRVAGAVERSARAIKPAPIASVMSRPTITTRLTYSRERGSAQDIGSGVLFAEPARGK